MKHPKSIAEEVLLPAFGRDQDSDYKWNYYYILRQFLITTINVFRAGNFSTSMKTCDWYRGVCREFVAGTAYEGCTDQFFAACYSDLTTVTKNLIFLYKKRNIQLLNNFFITINIL
jgi:hypothetical protein